MKPPREARVLPVLVRRATLLVVSVLAAGCDALLTDPAPPPAMVEVSFQLVEPVIGGPAEAFAKIRWAGVRFTRPDQTSRDTVLLAAPVDGRIRIPVALEVQERVEALGIEASLGVGLSPLFRGATVVRIDPGEPTSAPIAVQPVPAAVVAERPLVLIPNVGQSVQIASAVLFATGDTITGLQGGWLSEDPAIVSVTPEGSATALQLGQTRLEVRLGALADTVVVATSPVDTVLVSPASATLPRGQTVQLSAVLEDAEGNVLVGRTVGWVSLSPNVATVDGAGLVTGVGPGTADIVVASGTAATTVPITVF